MKNPVPKQNLSVASDYFKSNQSVIEKYFEEQGKIIEVLYTGFPESDKHSLIAQLLNINKEVILNALETQKLGASYFFKGIECGTEIESRTDESDNSNQEQFFKIKQQGSRSEEYIVQEIRDTKRDILENWLKNELSSITGFPCDTINASTRFEEDLGLISINIVEIFAHLLNEFPEFKGENISNIARASTIGEMLELLTSSRPLPQNNNIDNSESSIENWLKAELSKITGFSTEIINRDTRFEEDLGLISINMVEIFAHLLDDFPEVKKDLRDVVGVSSVGEFIEVIAKNVVNEKRENTDNNEKEYFDNKSDEINNLLSKIKGRICDITGISEVTCTSETLFDDLNINIFALEKIYDEELSLYPSYSLFKQELLNAGNFEQVLSKLEFLVGSKDEKAHSNRECDISEVQRYVFDYEKLKLSHAASLPESILLVGEEGKAYEYFHESMVSRGIAVKTLYITDSGWKLTPESVDTIALNNQDKLAKYLDLYTDNSGRLPSLLFLAIGYGDPAEKAEYNQWDMQIQHSAIALFTISNLYSLRSDSEKNKKDKRFISILGQTNLSPAWSTARGFARSLTHDMRDIYSVRSVWLKDSYNFIPFEFILDAVCSGPTEYDMFIDLDCIMKRSVKHRPIKKTLKNKIDIGPESLLLLTGGGAGATAEIACSMAKQYKCKIVAIGRTAYPAVVTYEGIEDDEALKRRVFEDLALELGQADKVTRDIMDSRINMVSRQRAILNTKKRVERAGGEFYYYSCDVSKPDELCDTIRCIMEKHGEISGLIHGAGNINRHSKKTLESFKSVLQTKTHSTFCLYQLFRNYPLKFAVLFSSITAYTGRPGLTDYTAANELVNEFAQYWNERADYPVRSIMWSLWTETGLLSQSQHGVEHLGLKGVSNTVGTELFHNEFVYLDKSEDRVLLTHDSVLKFSMP